MASSNIYTAFFENCVNDLKREIIDEIRAKMENRELTNVKIQELLDEMLSSVNQNKKLPKRKAEKKPRISGYHLFMKEERVRVKQEQPDIRPQELTSVVAKSWKTLSDGDKETYNERAKVLKEEQMASEASESSQKTASEASNEKKQPAKKPAKKPTKKPASEASKPASEAADEKKPVKKAVKKPVKKPSPPPPPSDEEDEDIPSIVEEADSDIDL